MLDQLAPAQLQTTPPQTKGECRIYERMSCELTSFCQPVTVHGSTETMWCATICDISQGGVRLLVSRRYERGTSLAIELAGKDGKDSFTFFAKVVHITNKQNGLWSLGCQFVSPLSEDELTRLLGLHQADKPSIGEVQLQLVNGDGTQVDCLVKQLRIPKWWPLSAGQTVTLRGAVDAKPWLLKVQVMRCDLQGGRWKLQCKLLSSPEAAQAMLASNKAFNSKAPPQSPH